MRTPCPSSARCTFLISTSRQDTPSLTELAAATPAPCPVTALRQGDATRHLEIAAGSGHDHHVIGIEKLGEYADRVLKSALIGDILLCDGAHADDLSGLPRTSPPASTVCSYRYQETEPIIAWVIHQNARPASSLPLPSRTPGLRPGRWAAGPATGQGATQRSSREFLIDFPFYFLFKDRRYPKHARVLPPEGHLAAIFPLDSAAFRL